MIQRARPHTDGYLLVSALLAMTLLMLLGTAYITSSINSPRTANANASSLSGFMAAEGGLNMRAAEIRAQFVNFDRPSGVSPASAAECPGGGSGDFQCKTYTLGPQTVQTYVYETTRKDAAGNLVESGTVSPGETYAGLNYQQYAYRVISSAGQGGVTTANVEMEFQSRLVPMFQFAAFYADDLEINPGPDMTLNGRVHTNGALYLSPGAKLNITGQTTAGQDIHRTRKDGARPCNAGTLIFAGTTAPGCGNAILTPAQLAAFKGTVSARQPALTVPPLGSLAPDRANTGSNEAWSKADVRIVMSPLGVVTVQRADGVPDLSATLALQGCAGSVTMSSTFYDAREKRNITMMDVDQARVTKCIQESKKFTAADGKVLAMDDKSGGGLALHFSVSPEPLAGSADQNKYGVRILNGAQLGPVGGPSPKGLTVATNQPLYVQGDYNVTNPVPASLMGDTMNVLSKGWNDTKKTSASTSLATAAPTEVRAAFLAGTDKTVNSSYNGGLENYPRFHENWGGVKFKYTGSFVSLGTPLKARGAWGQANVYGAPTRDWSYDESFNSASNLPPLTPRFVYLRQLFFAREY